jgi:hypothetical protein
MVHPFHCPYFEHCAPKIGMIKVCVQDCLQVHPLHPMVSLGIPIKEATRREVSESLMRAAITSHRWRTKKVRFDL